MTEQKRRGRPPKRERLDVEADIGTLDRPPYVAERVSAAQAYADRVWAGQSPSALRSWRVQRVREALEGQGFSLDGVSLPDGPEGGEAVLTAEEKAWRKPLSVSDKGIV